MDIVKKIFKDKIILNIALILFGLVLLLFPLESISITSKIIAGIFIVAGLSNIIYFFVDGDVKDKMDTIYFVISLIGIGIGIYTFINPTWLVTTINVIVGIILLISSVNILLQLLIL